MGLSFRYIVGPCLLFLSGGALAFGLGELRDQPILGEALRLEIGLVESGKRLPDASCFELVKPLANDLPWLRQATLSVRRRGDVPLLEIRSGSPLRDPLLRVAVRVGCGHEMQREYVLAANPPSGGAVPVERPAMPVASAEPPARRAAAPRRHSRPSRPALLVSPAPLPVPAALPEGAEQLLSLRMIPELFMERGAVQDAERDILRMEFRMLAALNEQATAQLAAAEKLRSMEEAFGDLQRQVGGFAQRVEQESGVVAAKTPIPPPAAPVAAATDSGMDGGGPSRWSVYGALGGMLLGLLGWFGWQRFGVRRGSVEREFPVLPETGPEPVVPPPQQAAIPPAPGQGIELDEPPREPALSFEAVPPAPPVEPSPPVAVRDPTGSLEATSLDEHFEASPVMELAEIMLTFGRVKGAAQALQEYIDHNPQEALQPWVRLMDVYRLAGMREEFETVARNLNRNFNVEVQFWGGDSAPAVDEGSPRARSIEDIRHVMARVEELWPTGNADGYLHQLLRDNRGGQRLGFPLPVVEDILFLIDLAEAVRRLDSSV